MPTLGVNIDHVATLRQARYTGFPYGGFQVEPDLGAAALDAEAGGASGITIHLREDRRHIQDQDLFELKKKVTTKINLEMGNTHEILEIALKLQPEDVCLVPEKREEITTEGGLDCVGLETSLAPTVNQLQQAGIRVSMFIDPEPEQVSAAAHLGAPVVELHTGAYANTQGEEREREWHRLFQAAEKAHALGMQVNVGHGINYQNIVRILALPHLEELNIGHTIVSRALSVGLKTAVAEMVAKIKETSGRESPT